ncbi:unnamed protein product [Pleuronectes platessa]|uniref:Uncharacterized protein n=1 Tax=Pleuronectes platessa TaxID=8262 RepID=A0A9N7YZX8_PLEPL|nr:unnamed protein product [Pleuronectes platessa]
MCQVLCSSALSGTFPIQRRYPADHVFLCAEATSLPPQLVFSEGGSTATGVAACCAGLHSSPTPHGGRRHAARAFASVSPLASRLVSFRPPPATRLRSLLDSDLFVCPRIDVRVHFFVPHFALLLAAPLCYRVPLLCQTRPKCVRALASPLKGPLTDFHTQSSTENKPVLLVCVLSLEFSHQPCVKCVFTNSASDVVSHQASSPFFVSGSEAGQPADGRLQDLSDSALVCAARWHGDALLSAATEFLAPGLTDHSLAVCALVGLGVLYEMLVGRSVDPYTTGPLSHDHVLPGGTEALICLFCSRLPRGLSRVLVSSCPVLNRLFPLLHKHLDRHSAATTGAAVNTILPGAGLGPLLATAPPFLPVTPRRRTRTRRAFKPPAPELTPRPASQASAGHLQLL